MPNEDGHAEIVPAVIPDWIERRVHPIRGYPICGRPLKHLNKYGVKVCTQKRIAGRDSCKMHGGRNPVGMAAGNYKHGRTSKYLGILSGKMRERFETAVNDPDLLALNDQIALIDARVMELFDEMADGGAPVRLWQDLREAKRQMIAAREAGNAAQMAYHMNTLLDLVDRGAAVTASWAEAVNLFERRRRLTETERKRRIDTQTYATAEEQMFLISNLSDLVREYVKDPEALRGISDGLIRLLGARTRPDDQPG